MAGLPRAARLVLRLALTGAIATPLYLVYRRKQLRWGATDVEMARGLPGDEIQPTPMFNATRAITIDASPERIWPWLLQWGYHRAGLYSGLDWLDNGGVPSADRIVPELQHLGLGDHLPIAARDVPVAGVPEISYRVVAIEPYRSILSQASDIPESWLWLLESLNEQQTRLLWRIRWARYDWTSPYIVLKLLTDLGDFVIVRNILLGIKERAERRPVGSLAATTSQAALWFVAFLSFLVSLGALVLRRDWLRPLAAVGATYAITLGLVFAVPPLWVDTIAALGVAAGLRWLYRTGPRGQQGTGGWRRAGDEVTMGGSKLGGVVRAGAGHARGG